MKPFLLSIITLAFLSACSGSNQNVAKETVTLEVYKSPTCGCCGQWVSHIKSEGFVVKTHNRQSLDSIKQQFNIPTNLQSCHTGVSKDGYFFEGHIPAKFIHQFLAQPPAGARGLTVPGMPVGSPGMEMGNRFTSYPILLVMEDGSTQVFAKIGSKEEQY